MERERAKPLEGRTMAAHVGCCVVVVLDGGLLWLAVEYPNWQRPQPRPGGDYTDGGRPKMK